MMMKTLRIVVVGLALVASTANAQRVLHQNPIKDLPMPVLLDNAGMFQDRYAKVGDDMFIGGQPTEKALREMKAQGVTTVINLRTPPEITPERIGFDEAKLIAELGMKYVHVPMRGAEGDMAYSPANLKKVIDAIEAADGKVLLHCTIAWRASHVWAAYLMQHGVSDADALKHTRAINLMDEHRMDSSGSQPVELFLGRKVQGLGKPNAP